MLLWSVPDLFSAYDELARGLKQVGARVTGIGHTAQSRLSPKLKPWLDHYVQVPSLLDANSLLEGSRQAGQHHPLDLIETGDESLVLITAQIRQVLELPGLSVRSATLCRDKPAMKEALREVGVPCAASAGVDSMSELLAFSSKVGFPLILKPRSALGGLGTYRVENAKELQAAGRELGLENGKSVAVEEFIEGHEGFYDTLSVDGEPIHEFISHYYPNVLPALKDRSVSPQIAATNRVELESYDELRRMGRKVIQALGIGTAATHMEWFFGSRGLKFSEIGARPPGERIWDLYCVGNDLDIWKEWAMTRVHGQPGGRLSRRFATGSVQVRPEREGRIDGYEGLDDVRKVCGPWITQYHLTPAGSPTVPVFKGYLHNAWFRLKHPDYDQLLAMMTFIGDRLKVRAS